MMLRIAVYAWLSAIVLVLALLSACESLLASLKNPAIESILAVQVAGVYTVTITKDGKPFLVETWKCDMGPDGKLAGCHKQAGSPAP